MTTVFLDTVGLIALWDASDEWHEVASQAHAQLCKGPVRFFTSGFVLLECGNASARKPYRDHVDKLRVEFEQAGQLIMPSDEDWQLAWIDYRNRTVGNAGIVDHVSFRIMRRLGLRKAFTNDRHFETAGFEILF